MNLWSTWCCMGSNMAKRNEKIEVMVEAIPLDKIEHKVVEAFRES